MIARTLKKWQKSNCTYGMIMSMSCIFLILHSPWGKRCKQKAVSYWWERCRTRSGTSGWEGCAGSCQPETWSRQCCRQSTCRLPERGWQICPVGKRCKWQLGDNCWTIIQTKTLNWTIRVSIFCTIKIIKNNNFLKSLYHKWQTYR